MLNTRFSIPEDIPVLRRLWKLAFGDSDSYIDLFFQDYYRPERAIVVEEDGQVRAMTLWFDSGFSFPGQARYRSAYLYAVATHPDCRGRGLAARLLADAGELLRELGFALLTTVPAQPSLHDFFGSNGFSECFTHVEYSLTPFYTETPGVSLSPVPVSKYAITRESLLSRIPHIDYPDEVLYHQAACCRLDGGGLYLAQTPSGPVCLCAEGAGSGQMIAKELLGKESSIRFAIPLLAKIAPGCHWQVRCPSSSVFPYSPQISFGMLRWLIPDIPLSFGISTNGYLGLAFD